MLNPSEIANKKFDKSMGRGYKAEEVERYLTQLSGEVGELLSDKGDLEQKLMVLADKLEEYKNDEESLRSALLGAQKLGDSVVRDSKARAEQIIEDANARANTMVEDARRLIEREQASFLRMQHEVATFKSRLQLLYKQHLELISSIPVDESVLGAASRAASPPETPAELPEFEDDETGEPSADDVRDELPLPDALLEYSEQPLEYTDDDAYSLEPEPEQPPVKRESRFGPLKFGREFDIKRDDDKRKK